MKKIFFLVICVNVFAQTPQVIKNKNLYKGEAVILHKNIHYPFGNKHYKIGYTPTLKDIQKAENYFFANYYEYEATILDCLNFKDKCTKLLKWFISIILKSPSPVFLISKQQ